MIKTAVHSFVFFLLATVLWTVDAGKSVLTKDCRVWCTTKEGEKIHSKQFCKVNEWPDVDLNRFSMPSPTNIKLDVTCDNSSTSKVGILISWTLSSQDIRQHHIRKFIIGILTLIENNYSGLPQKDVNVFLPRNINCNHDVKFEYRFYGVKDAYELRKDHGYSITIESQVKSLENPENNSIRIPEYLDHIKGCEHNTTTEEPISTPVVPVTPPQTEIALLTIGIILVLILLVTIVILITRTCTQNTTETKRLLVLLNEAISDNDFKTRITTIATKLSRKQFVEEVRSNLWETNNAFILQWLQTQARWADFIILVSIPDSMERENPQFEAFNNALTSVLNNQIMKSYGERIVIIHEEKLENHKYCPLIQLDVSKKIRISDEISEELHENILKVKRREHNSEEDAPLLHA